MLDGHPFNVPLFELYCAPIYAPIAHHFFMNVRKHLSSFKSLQAQKMRYSFIFNDLCQTVKNSIGLVANHNAQFHICLQLLYLLTFSSVLYAIPHQFGTNSGFLVSQRLKLRHGIDQRIVCDMNIPIHCCFDAGMTQQLLQHFGLYAAFNRSCGIGMA